jgi:hypothetical protein
MSTTTTKRKPRDRRDLVTITIQRKALRRAQIAVAITGDSLCQFLSRASELESRKVIEQAGLKLPPDAAFASVPL